MEGARDELHELEGMVDRKREELAELTQKVESRRREAESCLREKSRQQTELQVREHHSVLMCEEEEELIPHSESADPEQVRRWVDAHDGLWFMCRRCRRS